MFASVLFLLPEAVIGRVSVSGFWYGVFQLLVYAALASTLLSLVYVFVSLRARAARRTRLLCASLNLAWVLLVCALLQPRGY